MKDFTTNHKGDITEVECILSFLKLGFKVSIPYGEDTKYDLILDVGNKLFKVQCKTSKEIKSSRGFKFKCYSTLKAEHGNTKITKYSNEDIDYFATTFNGRCYVVPVNLCHNERTLRFDVPANNQLKNVLFAQDYEVEKVFKEFLDT